MSLARPTLLVLGCLALVAWYALARSVPPPTARGTASAAGERSRADPSTSRNGPPGDPGRPGARPVTVVLRGRVVGEDKRPVRDATVLVDDGSERTRGAVHTRSDGGGRFALAIEAGSRARVRAERPGAGRSSWIGVDLPLHGELDLRDLVLRGKGRLAGRLLLPDGSPVVGVGVEARRLDGTLEAGFEQAATTTDGAGRFELGGLAPGAFELVLPEEPGFPDPAPPTILTDGPERVRVLQAAHVRVEADDGAGIPVALVELTVRREVAGSAPGFVPMEGPRARFDLLLALDTTWELSGRDVEGHTYGARVRPSAAALRPAVVLRPNAR